MEKNGTTEVGDQGRQRSGEPPEGAILTLAELATWLKISRATAWTIVMVRDQITYTCVGDRGIRLKKEAVDAYLTSRRNA